MARAKRARTVVLKVPRHGAQRIGLKFSLSVDSLVRKQHPPKPASQPPRVRYQHSNDPPAGALAQAVESASEWNSLLIGARAHRGPQWDVGTQQFQVDHGSTLYYDPAPLHHLLKQHRPQEEEHIQGAPTRPVSMQPPDFRHESPRIARNPSASAIQSSYPYGSPRHPQHQPVPFNPVPPGHFYADPRAAAGMGSMSPDIRRRPAGPGEGYIALHAA